VLLASLSLAGVLAALGGLFLRPSMEELALVERGGRRLQALALAEAGVADAIARLGDDRVAFEIGKRPAPTGAYYVSVTPDGDAYDRFTVQSEGVVALGGGRKLSQYVYATIEIERSEESSTWQLASWRSCARPPGGK